MSALEFLSLQAERRVPRIVVETRALFLAREAVAQRPDSPSLRETLERLCASNNAAIASEALRLMAPLRMLK